MTDTDIVVRLRQTRADMLGTDDEQHYWDCHGAADEIEQLREAIRRLADQDATLAVQGGNVIVTIDATLTAEERDVLSSAIDAINRQLRAPELVASLRQLKERVCHDDRVNYLRTPYKS